MGLSGTFDCLGAKATFNLFSTARLTGRLTVRTRSAQASLFLVDGQLAGVFSATGSELSTAGGWPELAEEICSRAFRGPRAAFDFTPEPDTEEHPQGPLIRLEQLVEGAAQRAASWKKVEAVIASPDVVARLADSLAGEAITLDRQQWMVVAQTDGRRNVAALARRVGLELLRCCQLVTALAEAGAVVIPPAPASVRCAPLLHVPEADAESDLAGTKAEADVAVAALHGASGDSAPELPAVLVLRRRAVSAAP